LDASPPDPLSSIWRGGTKRSDPDLFENGAELVSYPLVREPHDAIPAALEILLARAVRNSLLKVNLPVDFDDQSPSRAAEIHDELADGVLASKPQAAELAITQGIPQGFLGRSRCGSHRASDRLQSTP